jgi:NAD(P)-dependent dehydrogenase (short-subunit alcohol dehydrogenase family)
MKGRSALITGGSMGMGRGMAKRFAESGADVAIVARRPDQLAEAKAEIEKVAKGKVLSLPCDVTKRDQIEASFAQAVKTFGKVDILVNNAGSSKRGPFVELTDEEWAYDIELKLFGAIRFCRLAFPDMKARRWGRIINVLNTGAKAPSAGGAPTAVTRAAGMALTKVLAGEGAPHNVLVNALLTGRIVSDQWTRRHKKEYSHLTWEQFLKDQGKNLPMGRLGETVEFANMACFLASDAGSYITGTAINVDGGLSPVV